MKRHHTHFLFFLLICLTASTFNPTVASPSPFGENGGHFCGVTDSQPDRDRYAEPIKRSYARTAAANLNVGEPRTVRMIYFLPNDWQYRADIVQKMKDTIRTVQSFYAEQMDAHGYGKVTFRVETDPQGEPMVHRVDGKHPFSDYDNTLGSNVFSELQETYDFKANIYFIVLGTDALRQGNGQPASGVGYRRTKNGGMLLVANEFSWALVAHELGHTFGLNHDFREGAYIMSYGPGWNRLSPCAAEFLSVHPHFNPDTPIEEEQPPTIELISPRQYPAGSTSVPVRVQVSDSDGLHQVLLHAVGSLQMCRRLTGEKDALVEFDYDGGFGLEGFTSLSSSLTHGIRVEIVDTDGHESDVFFTLAESSPYHIADLPGNTDPVRSVSFSPDGILASGGWDRTVKLWNVETQRDFATLPHLNTVESVAFSSDGILASGSSGTVKLWDVATQQNIATLPEHGNHVSSVAFSPDGKTLASGRSDGMVKLWNVTTQQDFATLPHGVDHVLSVSFSLDGILASGGDDGMVKLWDVATQQNITTLTHGDPVLFVAFSPDGGTLAFGGWGKIPIKLWDVGTRQTIATLTHGSVVSSVAFSPDGETLASGGWDSTVKLWDLTTQVNFATFPNAGALYSVSFSPNGRILASGTAAGTVELWDTSEVMQLRVEALTEVDIPDKNLRTSIAEAIGVPPSASILRGHLENLTNLEARNANISDLTGLEFATNLRTLVLGRNSVTDISPLSGLTNLRMLRLSGNQIRDISPLSGLTNLRTLDLPSNITDMPLLVRVLSSMTHLTYLNLSDSNIAEVSVLIPVLSELTNLIDLNLSGDSITDLSPLAVLTNLTSLHLRNNNISDISAVAGLTNLTNLSLGNNNISDISAVAGLTNLSSISLWYNNISDISPLVENTGLGAQDWDWVGVRENPLSYQSIHTHIPTLQERGVTVAFDNRVATTLLNISGVITESDNVLTVEVRDSNGRTFEGVPVTFTVTSGGGTLSITSATTDPKGRAQSTLTLGADEQPNRVKVSAVGTERTVAFSDVAEAGVNIPDPNLRAAIENALGVTSGSPISPEKMATLTHFRARDWAKEASISLLIGLEFATNLTELRLGDNGITDISPLSGLTNLTELHLRNNRIRDISSLANLTNLTNLRLSYNQIEDISPLSELTHLTELRLSGNRVRDISPLSGLTNLTRLELPSGITDVPLLVGVLSRLTHLTSLNLSDSNIGDVSALVPVLSGLTNLIDLILSGNGITDLSPLAVLTNLSSINLWNNNISDISAVAGLTNLTNLSLGNNNISDISAVAGLTNLSSINLWNNNISDISPLLENTGLGSQGWGRVSVRLNPLSYQSIHTHIPTLQSRGVTVDFDDQAHPALLKTLGDNQRRMPGETLANPFVVEAQDEKGSALVGISVTFTVTEGGGALSIQTTATDTNGRAESTLTLGPNLGPNTVEVSATGIKVPVTFNAEGVGTPTRPLKLSGDDQQGPSGTQLAEPFVVEVRDQYDNPLPDVEVTFKVTAGGGTLSPQSTKTDADGRAESTLTLGSNPGINTVSVFVAGIEEVVTFNAIGEIEFNLSVPEGISLIHVPLKVTAVDGKPKTIESIGDLYDALGGSANVNVLITYNTQKQRWNSYLGDQYRGRPSDKALTDDLGIVASMKAAKSMLLSGDALGTNGNSSITLHPGTNLVGVPLRDSRITRVSDLFALEGIGGNVSVIIVSNNGEFQVVARAGDAGDIPITGGGSFILTARDAETVVIEGGGWYNRLEPTAASPMTLTGIKVEDTTPVLAVSGSIGSPVGGASLPRPSGWGFRVTVKNLSTGKVDTAVTDDNGVGYQFTFVNTETGRAAQVGDILEITAQSPDPFVGVQPLRYVVTPTDVKRNHIPLDELVAYEIPEETELLLNYPNPFNPETWIPYRLAEDAFVRLTIYDLSGGVIRRLDVGLMIAAVYESRAKAIYWDGRNGLGERVASGIYFYHLSAGDYSATRKMVISK